MTLSNINVKATIWVWDICLQSSFNKILLNKQEDFFLGGGGAYIKEIRSIKAFHTFIEMLLKCWDRESIMVEIF